MGRTLFEHEGPDAYAQAIAVLWGVLLPTFLGLWLVSLWPRPTVLPA